MNVLIDINHPAHVHYFRNVYKLLRERGHTVYFVSRNKEIEHKLLNSYQIPFYNRGKGSNGKIGKLLYLIYANYKLYLIARKLKIDLFLNFLHPYPSQVARLLRKTSLVFSDSEHARLHHKLTTPFATKVFTPACYKIDLGAKHIRFKGFMELAYLHPSRFRPDATVLNWLGVTESENFVIIRFVSWTAVHDQGHSGMTLQNKRKAVKELSKLAKVYISSEAELPPDLEAYRIKIPSDKIHDALYFSTLLLGESATMASEAAVLGTPAIFINSIQLGYLEQQENQYGLVYNFNDMACEQEKAIAKAIEILQDPDSKQKYRRRREKLLSECIDTTQFMLDEVLKHDATPVRPLAMPAKALTNSY